MNKIKDLNAIADSSDEVFDELISELDNEELELEGIDEQFIDSLMKNMGSSLDEVKRSLSLAVKYGIMREREMFEE